MLAKRYKALGDELRLRVLRALRDDSFGVLELSEIFSMRQSGMSHHLKTLANAGLVTTRREGTSVFYRRCVVAQDSVIQAILQELDVAPLDEEVARGVEKIRAERLQQAQAFFAKNAERFEVQQELISDFEQYADLAESMLALATGQQKKVIELGPGTGQFIATLAQRYQHVCAVDISEQMLAQAKKRNQALALKNVSYVHGELGDLADQTVDAIVANMVLHHMPAPADVFRHSGHMLSNGGVLLVTDLCEHDQAWAREACGDMWLGFDQQQLVDWAAQAGLALHQSSFMALRNGFQVQCLLFEKNV
ncbi:ArsR/SmtB family transcription factor [Salinibius halmophilus]|uniref:ArsR/SmtB family transcription factor n=1 Tax=Salinibius halmophilus TaxID=1853216 RepID=UPI001F1D17ED|nr:metalloregulator ArsR/SmtB family transcription factor [Salinibius halmophilus]